MNLNEYIAIMKDVQMKLIKFLECECNTEENYGNLCIIIDYFFRSNQYNLKIFLYLINQISNEHHRNQNFITKIEFIIERIKNEMKKFYSNCEIFRIFKKNKRILLFLIENKIIIIDKYIYDEMIRQKYKSFKYPEYFCQEITSFIEEELNKKQKCDEYLSECKVIYELGQEKVRENKEQFNKKRRNGENDNHLCQIIQNDLIEDFIIYVNEFNHPLHSYIEKSIFETNCFLLEHEKTTLIEYAAFFGSVRIFKYLYKNGIELTQSLWLYGIHGNNEEILHILEDPYSEDECFYESMKCHHNHIAYYIKKNFLNTNINIDIEHSFQYYNFSFFPEDFVNNTVFLYACKYDYFLIVQYLLNTKKIDINYKVI